MRNDNDSAGTLSSVSNALRVLDLLADGVELRVVDVATELGVANATAHRVLAALREHGYLRQPPGSPRYVAGPAVMRLTRRVSFERMLRAVAAPHLLALCRDLKETVNLQLLLGADVIFIASEEDQHQLRVVQRRGTRGPAHANAGGKVLLAALNDDEVRRLVGPSLTALSRKTITDPDRLIADLQRVRKRGFGTNLGENDDDVNAVAVPVVGPDGETLAALSLAAPQTRLPNVRIPMVVPPLQRSADAIAADFAGHPRTQGGRGRHSS